MGHIELGELAAKFVLELEPNDPGYHILFLIYMLMLADGLKWLE